MMECPPIPAAMPFQVTDGHGNVDPTVEAWTLIPFGQPFLYDASIGCTCAKENGWWSPQKVWWNPDPTNYPVGWCDDDPGHDNDGRVWAIRVVDADSPMVRQTVEQPSTPSPTTGDEHQ